MLPADVARCSGNFCSAKNYCLRYTTPVTDPDRQVWMHSPHLEGVEFECTEFMYDLKIGDRAKFFHPGTLGVMLSAKVMEILDNGNIKVKFDRPHQNGKRVFVVPPDHNP